MMFPRKNLSAAIALLAVAALFAIPEFYSDEAPLTRYAEKIIAACRDVSYRAACYDDEVPKLMDRGLSMEQAFEVTKLIQSRVNDYFYCHVLGHRLSEKETAKDPARWTDVVRRCPAGMCSNGCLHGAAQERYRNEILTDEQLHTVIPELRTVCDGEEGRDFTGLEQASCYHALGHLGMYVTDADIARSTALCDAVAKHGDIDYVETCYEGVYMQMFQPLEPSDVWLVKDIAPTTRVAAETFCDSFSGARRGACHRESWPLYRESLTDPEGLESFCSLMEDASSKKTCYMGIFYVLAAQMNFKVDRITSFCKSVVPERVGQCFANSASRLLETDYQLIPGAVSLCEAAEEEGVGERCYRELLFYSVFNFHKGTDAFQKLCRALPEPWRSQCFAGDGASVRVGAVDDPF